MGGAYGSGVVGSIMVVARRTTRRTRRSCTDAAFLTFQPRGTTHGMEPTKSEAAVEMYLLQYWKREIFEDLLADSS